MKPSEEKIIGNVRTIPVYEYWSPDRNSKFDLIPRRIYTTDS